MSGWLFRGIAVNAAGWALLGAGEETDNWSFRLGALACFVAVIVGVFTSE
jgi:hypothetical protein